MMKVKVHVNIMDFGYEKEDQKDFKNEEGVKEFQNVTREYMKQEYKNEKYEIEVKILNGKKKSKCLIDNCKKCGNDLFNFLEHWTAFDFDKFWINGL